MMTWVPCPLVGVLDGPVTTWIYADRVAGRDRDHRRPRGPAPARGAIGARSGEANPVHESLETDRARDTQLPRLLQYPADRLRRDAQPVGQPCVPGLGAAGANPALPGGPA